MNKATLLATASVLAAAIAAPSFAQSDITGISALNDRLNDVERDVSIQMSRGDDPARFGSPEQRQGLSGSASLGYSGKTGNNESQDFTLGLRLTDVRGPFVQNIGAVLDFSESNKSSTKEDVFGIYDANYYFDDRFYMFGMARIESDGLADTLTAQEKQENADAIAAGNPAPHDIARKVKQDGFIGFGPGYRVISQSDMTWRVQAGIGVSYLKYGDGRSETEKAGIVSSRFYYRFSDTMFLTNDTDILKSSSALRANNDFGINFKVTEAISTRLSYLTEYNDSRAKRTDNKLGLAVVFGF